MEILFMSAGIVVTIVLAIVGIIKLPFDKFKQQHPQWYKAVFTLVSIVLSVGLAVLDELYLLQGQILSLDFAVLVCVVLAGVFAGYGGVYEGLGLKELMKKIRKNLKKAKEIAKDKKVVDFLNKVEDIDKAMALLEERKKSEEIV